jgi:hypothetical protein
VESFNNWSASPTIHNIHAQNDLDIFVTPIPPDLTIELRE